MSNISDIFARGEDYTGKTFIIHLFNGRTFIGSFVAITKNYDVILTNYYEMREMTGPQGQIAFSITEAFPFLQENRPSIITILEKEIFVGKLAPDSMVEYHNKALEMERASKSGIALAQSVPTGTRSSQLISK